jgi:hypothetical protein
MAHTQALDAKEDFAPATDFERGGTGLAEETAAAQSTATATFTTGDKT